ncbi:cell division protein ZapA [Nitrosomonas supralitoralis]|uniref:Cell division protein ZapA n=1 Tax=Nitrosomonas supralitoralis TaxID=2116706 RepID=A0A2P7NZF7_9PROT|nr:cell division protein ZapA [Nitrosomonas supralitoralis]PSJ18851.1 cell division protein ZapA [Nitrosomonas supralitoralis]
MNNTPLNIIILGREFTIACLDEEREEIQLAAAYLDNKANAIKAEGKIVDSDRIAIITALKITHELLMLRNTTSFDIDEFRRRIITLKKKVDEAITMKD